MTDSPATPSAKGDPQGPSIHVDSGTPSSAGPPAVSAPAAPGESASRADLLSTEAGAPSALSAAVATAAGSSHHPSPESLSSPEAGSLSRSGTSTEHNLSHMGGGFSAKRLRSEYDTEVFLQELHEVQASGGRDTESSLAGSSGQHEATVPVPSDGGNNAKRIKRTNGASGDDGNDNDNDGDDGGNDGDNDGNDGNDDDGNDGNDDDIYDA